MGKKMLEKATEKVTQDTVRSQMTMLQLNPSDLIKKFADRSATPRPATFRRMSMFKDPNQSAVSIRASPPDDKRSGVSLAKQLAKQLTNTSDGSSKRDSFGSSRSLSKTK